MKIIWMGGHTLTDWINENIQGKFEAAPLRDRMGQTRRLRHVQRKPQIKH